NGSVTINPVPSYGDADENEAIQAYDAAMVLKHVVGLDTLFCQGLVNADVSANDTVTAMDASLILQYGTGLIDTLPYSEPALASGSLHFGTPYNVDGFAYIPLVITNGEMVYSLEGELVYDETFLRYEGMVWSNPITDSVMERTVEGKTIIAGAGVGGWNYSGTVATVQFSFLHVGSGTVTLRHHRLNENSISPDDAVDVSSLGTESEPIVPTTYALHQNYPNPFNPETVIQFDLPKRSTVKLTIHDILGREVRHLITMDRKAGIYRVVWNGKDDFGNLLPAGVYLTTLEAGDYRKTIKMVLMK
ncbi:MAG: FlgD immunoglobulin-like domain containing protein, partial [Fidelibacterota bacterium]